MVSLISVPTGPRIFSTAWFSVRPCTCSSSRWVMKSLARMPALRGRRVVDRRDDLDQAVLHRDLDAEAAELAAGLHLHVAEALGVQVARMRVERGQHAVDRGLDQLGLVGLLDIVGADALEHVAEQVELLVGVGIGRRPGHAEGVPERARRTRHPPAPDRNSATGNSSSSTRLFQTADPPGTRINGLCAVSEFNIQHRPPSCTTSPKSVTEAGP